MTSTKYISIGLLSLTILATELFWTRIFSAEFYYTFAFLVLSLAVLGLGLGALFFKLVIRTPRPVLLPLWLICSGVMILIAIPIVFSLNLNFAKLISEPGQVVKLFAVIFLLGSAYFFGGVGLAHILKTNSENIPKLYMADFLGAAIGVVAFIGVMNSWGAVVTLLFCATPVLIAAFLTGQGKSRWIPVMILAGASAFYGWKGSLPEQVREERAKVVYKHWDATAKIKVFEYDSASRGINIDNLANTPVYQFDGNWNVPDSQKVNFDIDVRNLMMKFQKCRFLSLGAGGGTDVLQALQYNAAEVHAVEVVPHINYLMKEGFLNKFSGRIYNDPRVTVVTEDARAYIRRFKNKFDVIYSLSSNTFAAFASGSFALAENYLFTKEAFRDYWRALSDSGYMSIEHQFYTPRLVAELLEALQDMKVVNPTSHFAVYDLASLRRKVLLISKLPLDDQTIATVYGNSSPNVVQATRRLFPAMENNKNNIIDAIVQSGWKIVADTAKIDVSPCSDDRPFIAQLGLLRNIEFSKLEKIPLFEFTGFPLSRIILIILLIISLVCIVPLTLLPYCIKGEKLGVVPWSYFFTIGLAYMMVEVVLIQKYTLFIGSTIYSLALVLTVLLVMSGIGSGHSQRYSQKKIFLFIAAWLFADIFVFRHLFYLFDHWTLVPRLILSGILIAPVGYFMGMPFPKAASRCSDLVDWAFAINASASVIGSIIVILIASSFGYSVALAGAVALYGIAYTLYSAGFVKGADIQ